MEYKISIVVPIYNEKAYLRKCIESIINQSYKNIEIILVDDGSSDGSSAVCDYYAHVDNRIRVIHKQNGGLVSARKAGTEIATGDYIINVDGDDWIEKNRIENLVINGIMQYKADMIYLSGLTKEYENKSVPIEHNFPTGIFRGSEIKEDLFPLIYDIREAFVVRIYGAMFTWAIKRELLQEKQKMVDNRIIYGEDFICVWFCLLSSSSVAIIKEKGYHYTQRRTSLAHTAADLDNFEDIFRIWYHQLKTYLKEYKVFDGEIGQIFIYMVIYEIITVNYKLILKKHPDYLYPFPAVKSKCKIIIYGAGNVGTALMRYLTEIEDYQVVLWIDQNPNGHALPEYKISSIEDIGKVDYDYIVIAVMDANISKEIKKSLIFRGVPERKIATMDLSVINEEAIPDEILAEIKSPD